MVHHVDPDTAARETADKEPKYSIKQYHYLHKTCTVQEHDGLISKTRKYHRVKVRVWQMSSLRVWFVCVGGGGDEGGGQGLILVESEAVNRWEMPTQQLLITRESCWNRSNLSEWLGQPTPTTAHTSRPSIQALCCSERGTLMNKTAAPCVHGFLSGWRPFLYLNDYKNI